MRIIHVVPFYLPATRYGGPVSVVEGLCKALARRGHEVSVFTTNMDGAGESSVPLETPVERDGVTLHYYRVAKLRRVVWVPRLLLGLARELDASSVLHLHSVFTFPTTAVARLARLRRVPYVVSPHGALVARFMRQKSQLAKSLWLRLFDRRTLAQASRVHLTSENEQRELAALGLRIPDVIMAPNGAGARRELDELAGLGNPQALPEGPRRLGSEAPYGVFLGRISWVKGLDRLVRALAHTQARVLIIGHDDEGLRPELERSAAQLGVSTRLEFLGPLTGSAKWQLLRAARFLILPSYSENFGNVVAEAMALGCPVIVTPEVGAADVVRRANAGIVAEGTPTALGAAMDRLWFMEEERLQLGGAGARYAREHLTWDAIANVFEATYEQLLRERELVAGRSWAT